MDTYRYLIDDHWEFGSRDNPLSATGNGDHRYNNLLPSRTLESYTVRVRETRGFLKRLLDMLRENAWVQHSADATDLISGVEGQLFDHRVRCVRAPWALARLSGAAAVPVLVLADDDLRPQLLVGPAIHVASEGPAASAINAAFHTYLNFLEEALAGRRWNMSLRQWAGMAQGERGSRP